jgi:hypothetical protein
MVICWGACVALESVGWFQEPTDHNFIMIKSLKLVVSESTDCSQAAWDRFFSEEWRVGRILIVQFKSSRDNILFSSEQSGTSGNPFDRTRGFLLQLSVFGYSTSKLLLLVYLYHCICRLL